MPKVDIHIYVDDVCQTIVSYEELATYDRKLLSEHIRDALDLAEESG
jgi:hypothetical protein